MRDWLPEGEHPFRKLYQEYSALHDHNNEDKVSRTPWSYSCYYSGEKIQDNLRAKHRADSNVMFSIEAPFALSNRKSERMLGQRKKGLGFWEKVSM